MNRMSVVDRARFLLFGELPSRAKSVSASARNPFARIILALQGRDPIWTGEDYAALSEAGYQNCMTVYACVRLIAQTAAGIVWKAIDKEGEELENHAALRLLARPNERESQRAFIANFLSYRSLAGNAYILAGRVGNGPPAALWLLRPDRVKVIPGTNLNMVGGYTYQVGDQRQDFEVGNVLHSRMFHPNDDWYGLSPLRVAAKGIDISNMAAEWNAKVLTNDMRPPGALATDSALDDSAFRRLQTMVRQEWQGYENIGNPLILEQGLKWISFAMSPKDLDWLNSTKVTKRDICTVFNVDPCLIGDSEYATYSNKIEARRGLYQDNILPAMYELRDELNMWLLPMFGDGARLVIDRDQIDILQEDREKKFAYLAQADWLKVDEKRIATGFEPLGEEAGGEMVLVPIGKIPLQDVGSMAKPETEDPAEDTPEEADPSENEPPDSEPEGENYTQNASRKGDLPAWRPGKGAGFWAAPERKKALWQNFVARVEMKERGVMATARTFLREQAQRIAKAARARGLEATPGQLVNVRSEARSYLKATRAWYQDAAKRAFRAGQQAAKGDLPDLETKIDISGLTPAELEELSDMILYSGTKISEYTMALVRDLLHAAQQEKWTVEDYTQKLIDKLEDFSQFRCRAIARTETAKVENWGELAGYRVTEFVDRKGWLCSFVPESRDSHMQADGQEVGIDEDFIVNGQALSYPGDPRGDAGEVVNCLCSIYPISSEA